MDRNCVFTIITALLCLPLVNSLCDDLNCAVCNNGGNTCDQCEKGFTLKNYNCSPCPKNCLTCTAENYCQSCSPGFWAYQCLSTCLNNCNIEAGCEMVSGYCLKCDVGWYGPLCREECNRCENEQCNLRNYSTGCKDGYFEDINIGVSTCLPCPSFCKTCNSSSFCYQCNKGFWGDQCKNNCNSNCLDITAASELCHRNGTCYYGCKAGYMGSDCSQVYSTSPSPFSSSTTSQASTDERNLVSSSTTIILNSTEKRTTSITATQPDVKTTEAYLKTVSDYRGSLGPAIGGSIAGGFVLGVLAAAVVFYLRERILQKQRARTQSKNMYYNVSMAASHEEHSQSDTDRHLGRKDIELASASRQCEATLYEKLSEQNKGNLYDHLEQSSENEIMKEVGKLGSNVEYYNN